MFCASPTSAQIPGGGDGGERMASNVGGCRWNSPSRPPQHPSGQDSAPPRSWSVTPCSSPRGLWRLGPLGQNHGGKALQSKNSSRTPSPCEPPAWVPWLFSPSALAPGQLPTSPPEPTRRRDVPCLLFLSFPTPRGPWLPSLYVAHRRLWAAMAQTYRAQTTTSGICGPEPRCRSRT